MLKLVLLSQAEGKEGQLRCIRIFRLRKLVHVVCYNRWRCAPQHLLAMQKSLPLCNLPFLFVTASCTLKPASRLRTGILRYLEVLAFAADYPLFCIFPLILILWRDTQAIKSEWLATKDARTQRLELHLCLMRDSRRSHSILELSRICMRVQVLESFKIIERHHLTFLENANLPWYWWFHSRLSRLLAFLLWGSYTAEFGWF